MAVIIIASDFLVTPNGIETIATKKLNIPSQKTLLRIWIEKIKRLARKSVEEFGKHFKGSHDAIPIFVMTTEKENDLIFEAMKQEDFYGYGTTYVFPQVRSPHITQKVLPAFSQNGLIQMGAKDRIELFPNGSGGIFQALRQYKILDELQEFGTEYVHIIDSANLLGKPGDPAVLGLMHQDKKQVGVKTFNVANRPEL